MSNNNNVEAAAWTAAQGQLDAYNRRNIDEFCSWYSEDVVLETLSDGKVFCEGKAQLQQRYGPMFANAKELHCKLVKRIVCGNFAIDEEIVEGLIPNTTVHAVATYKIDSNGKICHAWFIRE